MMHSRPTATVLTAVLAVFVLVPAADARQPSPSPEAAGELGEMFTEAISVDLVNVEAFVTERSGAPILDLSSEDFRVYEDGREVELTHFALVRPRSEGSGGRGTSPEPARSAAPGASTLPTQEAGPATVVVFLDFLHTGPASRERIGRRLGRSLEREMRPGDRAMVIAYDGGLDVVQPLTSDPGEVRTALESLRPITAYQIQSNFADRRALEAVRLNQMTEAAGSKHPSGTCVHIGGLAEPYADQAYHRVQQTIDALAGFVDSLAGLEGRKVLLHVSDGIPLVPGGQLLSYAIELCDGTGMAAGIDYSEDVTTLGDKQRHRWDPFAAKQRLNELDTTRDWQRLAAHANVQQVSFYPIQAAGLSSTGLVDVASDIRMTGRTLNFGVRNRQDSLDLIARETGGRAILDSNDPARGAEAALEDSRTHYLLAFEPSATEVGSVHRIRVEVEQPGVRIRHRKSYRAKGAHEQVADGVLTALFYEVTDNPLEAEVVAVSSGRRDDGRRTVRVRVLVPLPRLALLPRGERFEGLFTVFIAARDEEGTATPVRRATIPVSVSLEGMVRDFVYEAELTLDAGRHDLAVGLRDEIGGTTAYLRREISTLGPG